MHRFFISPESIKDTLCYFPVEIIHQVIRVLRLREGECVVVLDNRGSEFLVKLISLTPKEVVGKIINRSEVKNEPQIRLTLYLCLSQREKFEWILQKCTEIGAAAFVPVISERSLVQDEAGVLKKMDRWVSIIREAAEQSGRGLIPELAPAMPIQQLLTGKLAGGFNEYQVAMMPWEEEHTMTIRQAMDGGADRRGRVAALIGPEGGFSVKETDMAQRCGFKLVTLGPRILRMETAAIVTTTLILNL